MSRIVCLLGMFGVASAGCIRIETVVESSNAGAPIVFNAPIPLPPDALKLYRLEGARIEPSLAQLLPACFAPQESSPSNDPMMKAPPKEPGAMRLNPRCSIDRESGEIDFRPDFSALSIERREKPLDRAAQVERAKSFLESPGVIPRDGRGEPAFEVSPGFVLKHQRVRRSAATGADPAGKIADPAANPILTYVAAQRRVGNFRVAGPGSRATVMIGPGDEIEGFTRSWKMASEAEEVEPARDGPSVRAEIERQLLSLEPPSTIHVHRVELVYYDGGQQLLQPAYRFVAELSADHRSLGQTQHVVGFVAYAETAEKIPQLGDAASRIFENVEAPASEALARSANPNEIKVGRYVARDDNKGWARDAIDFWTTLKAYDRSNRFAENELVPARPEHFTTVGNEYVNHVDIALVEAHGEPFRFATEDNCCDPVAIGGEAFPATGYGAAAGGRLKHWILHSCDVVQTPADDPRATERWWAVFKGGLKSVVGYRSSMYINDQAGSALGRRIGRGDPIVPAWFSAVASLSAYSFDPYTERACGGFEPMGRPAAITACGAVLAAAGDDPAVEPDCLDAWWLEDRVVRARSKRPNDTE